MSAKRGIGRSGMDFPDPFDVVVLGGGNAALCAAITAARAGCSVIVVEGAPKFYRGGNTRHTRNLRCAHDGSAPTMTGPYAAKSSSTIFTASPAARPTRRLPRSLSRAPRNCCRGWASRACVSSRRSAARCRSARPMRSFLAAAAARSTRSTGRRWRSASPSFTTRR